MKVIVVLPAFNEEKNLPSMVERIFTVIRSENLPLDILIVDDGSVDKTGEIAAKLSRASDKVFVASHPHNLGFAAALRTGIAYVLANSYDAGIFMDCDQTHDPADLPKFVKALANGADFVVGSRYASGGGMVDVPWHRVLISRVGNTLGRVVFRLPVADASAGYRAIDRKGLAAMKLEQNDFSIQVEEVLRGRQLGLTFKEVPVVLTNRQIGVSHFNLSLGVFWRYAALLVRSLTWR